MQRALLAVALAAGSASAADAPPEPPDAELLEFLGESAGVDVELVLFVGSRAAARAIEDTAEKEPKDDDDE